MNNEQQTPITIADLMKSLYEKGLEFSIRPDYFHHGVVIEVRKRDGANVLAKSEHLFLKSDLNQEYSNDFVGVALRFRMQDVENLLTGNSHISLHSNSTTL